MSLVLSPLLLVRIDTIAHPEGLTLLFRSALSRGEIIWHPMARCRWYLARGTRHDLSPGGHEEKGSENLHEQLSRAAIEDLGGMIRCVKVGSEVFLFHLD